MYRLVVLKMSRRQLLIEVLKRISIFVEDTGVVKGWDWLILPDGTKVEIPEGKYFKVEEVAPDRWICGIEDLTEEIDQIPDWDFNEPSFTLELVNGKVRIRDVFIEAAYILQLRFNQTILTRIGRGVFNVPGEGVIEERDRAMEGAVLGLTGGGFSGGTTKRVGYAVLGGLAGLTLGALIGSFAKYLSIVENTLPEELIGGGTYAVYGARMIIT